MQTERLQWDEIKRLYNKEWVQLVDYVWQEGEPYPAAGHVRAHAPDRKEFFRKVREIHPKITDSAFLFVGVPEQDGSVIHSNFHKVVS